MAEPATAGASERVARLLDELTAAGGPQAEAVEELVRALSGLYGDALRTITSLVDAPTLQRMAEDPLVGGLLVLHELHPQDTAERVAAALDRLAPALGRHAGGVEFLGVDDELVVHLSLQGSCDGCPSSLVTVRDAIERAVRDAAPEVCGVQVLGVAEEPAPQALLQIEPRPAYAADGSQCPAVAGAG